MAPSIWNVFSSTNAKTVSSRESSFGFAHGGNCPVKYTQRKAKTATAAMPARRSTECPEWRFRSQE